MSRTDERLSEEALASLLSDGGAGTLTVPDAGPGSEAVPDTLPATGSETARPVGESPDRLASGDRWPLRSPRVAVVHDYLTQRGGAERVVLSLLRAFPGADIHTSLYEPGSTFPEFQQVGVRTSALNRVETFRRRHRVALPLLAPTFSGVQVDCEVAICSSSGWAHGVRTTGRKVVYCYTPARWLYQPSEYLGSRPGGAARVALGCLSPALRRWDRRAAATADRYLTTSTEVKRRIAQHYGLEAEVLPPPPSVQFDDPRQPVEGVEPGYWLCVSRLLPYKNVGAILAAFDQLPGQRLVVVGRGPEAPALRLAAGQNVTMIDKVTDAELCWLYANSRGLVAASREDFGLTPLEAAVFGKPSVVLEWGGFVDTVVEGLNGTFFAEPTPHEIKRAVREASRTGWSEEAIRRHAGLFDEGRFAERLREIVLEEAALSSAPAAAMLRGSSPAPGEPAPTTSWGRPTPALTTLT